MTHLVEGTTGVVRPGAAGAGAGAELSLSGDAILSGPDIVPLDTVVRGSGSPPGIPVPTTRDYIVSGRAKVVLPGGVKVTLSVQSDGAGELVSSVRGGPTLGPVNVTGTEFFSADSGRHTDDIETRPVDVESADNSATNANTPAGPDTDGAYGWFDEFGVPWGEFFTIDAGLTITDVLQSWIHTRTGVVLPAPPDVTIYPNGRITGNIVLAAGPAIPPAGVTFGPPADMDWSLILVDLSVFPTNQDIDLTGLTQTTIATGTATAGTNAIDVTFTNPGYVYGLFLKVADPATIPGVVIFIDGSTLASTQHDYPFGPGFTIYGSDNPGFPTWSMFNPLLAAARLYVDTAAVGYAVGTVPDTTLRPHAIKRVALTAGDTVSLYLEAGDAPTVKAGAGTGLSIDPV